jgi:UDP-N-acetylmuramoyl-L-alanyl-D-glutamate--2,6-diaminopimelate ligase
VTYLEKKLSTLLNSFETKEIMLDKFTLEQKIKGISANSTCIKKEYLFIAVYGATKTSKNGHDFIDDAIKNGARAVIVDKNFIPKKTYRIPLIHAVDSKIALCKIAEAFYDYPSSHLKVIGITGTNGKTSTSFMLYSILKQAGFKPKIMGTLGMGEPNDLIKLSHTTMGPEFISASLANMKAQGVTHVIMEISSHALSLKRVEAIKFGAVGLTNITTEHLDFHKTIDEYRNAKARLFLELAHNETVMAFPKKHPLLHKISKNDFILFGSAPNLDVAYKNIRKEANKTCFSLKIGSDIVLIDLPFMGDFHVKNACLAAALAFGLKVSVSDIARGLKNCPNIPGRLEPIKNTLGIRIFIDFAHTPHALSSLLKTVKKLNGKRIILVFGCGGERDRNKRPLMGKIAQKMADQIIITDDNPRNEDPKNIRQEILDGINDLTCVQEISDRRTAIEIAIKNAQKNDIVVIAGKGHENYQIIGANTQTFCDQDEVRKILDTI